MYYGMSKMRHRTTFSLDGDTVGRLRKLSGRWRVSQAEVVRRALSQAERLDESERQDPVEMLRVLHAAGGGVDPEKGEAYLAETHKARKHWRGE